MLKRFITVVTLTFLLLVPLQFPETSTEPIEVSEGEKPIPLPDNFDKVYKSFYSYNNNIDTSTVITFCNISLAYGLTSDKVEFEWLMGQILLESGARQYTLDKCNNQTLLLSNTGAVGFGQILRSTCLGYMRRSMNKNDSIIFKRFGISDYSFANNDSCTRQESWDMAEVWLSNETNNIAMWGKIMSGELKRRSLMKALVSYNIGPGGMRAYLDSGNTIVSHHYIRGIRARLKYVR